MLYRAASIVMQQSPILDAADQPATLCAVTTLEPRMVGAERACELALPALDEAIAPLREIGATLSLKLVLCLDEFVAAKRPDGTVPAYTLTTQLTRKVSALGGQLDVDTSARGAASLGFALEKVLSDLESGRVSAAIVGGVHSDYDPERIVALSEAGRLFTPDQLDALIPGESAAFAVLMLPATARRYGLEPRAQIHSCATAYDKARPDNDESAFEAVGMTAVARKAAEPMTELGLRAGWMLTDLSFETMRLFEFQAMSTRTQKLWCEPQYCDAPAQRLGFLGAAAMPLHLVLASEAWRTGWAPHAVAMSFAGSDGGERAAMLLSAPPDS
jgi:3-oxoacyl-[acyl-carrier-protein] synthase-1